MHKDTDIAWAAGFIEGEGWIGIRKDPLRSWAMGTLQVVNTNKALLEKLQALWGGPLYRADRQFSKRKTWSWVVCNKAAERVLRDILPYLVGKRRQAEILLALRDQINARGGLHWRKGKKGPPRKLTEAEQEQRRLWGEEVKRLNQGVMLHETEAEHN